MLFDVKVRGTIDAQFCRSQLVERIRLLSDKQGPPSRWDFGKGSSLDLAIVDIAVPGDQRINEKETEKITNYGDLKLENQLSFQSSLEP